MPQRASRSAGGARPIHPSTPAGRPRGQHSDRLRTQEDRPTVVLRHVQHRSIGVGLDEVLAWCGAFVQEQSRDCGRGERPKQVGDVHRAGLGLLGFDGTRALRVPVGAGCGHRDPARRRRQPEYDGRRAARGGECDQGVERNGSGSFVGQQRSQREPRTRPGRHRGAEVVTPRNLRAVQARKIYQEGIGAEHALGLAGEGGEVAR